MGALQDEEVGRAVFLAFDLEGDAGCQKSVERDGILDRVGLKVTKSLLVGSLVGPRKMGGAKSQYD